MESQGQTSEQGGKFSHDGQSGSSLQGPCFVHSYLDNVLGSMKRGQSNPDPLVAADAPSEPPEAPSTEDDVAQQDVSDSAKRQAKKLSFRHPPMYRGMSGAVEPESDNDDMGSTSQNESESSFLSSGSTEDEESRVRSLTRQLAETAVGVREMSKQLGRARVKSTIQSILIITKARDNHLIKLTREIAIWLMATPRNGKDTGLIVYVDSQLRQSKRFDAEGIRREYPHLFSPVSSRNQSSSNGNSPPESLSNGKFSSTQTKDDGLLRFWTSDMCSRAPHLFDMVVTLGGDGTVLFCSWLFQRIVPPVMPFALGSLGFLTNFNFEEYKKVLVSALDTGVRVNLRMRFTATVYRATLASNSKADKRKRRAIKSGKTGEIIMKSIQEGGWNSIETPLPHSSDLRGTFTERNERNLDDDRKPMVADASCKKDKEVMCFSTRPVETFEILNDLVVDRGPSPYVSLLEVFGDEHHLTTAQADGLCIATPTGSTAYSLSAGGSLVHPEIPAILISPICPHTLSFRPMLLPDSMELRIAVPYNSRSTAWASFDGRGRVELKQGDHIKVTASKYPFPTVCAENQSIDWFESISRTLKWNERQRQKSFVVVEEGGEDATQGNVKHSMPRSALLKPGRDAKVDLDSRSSAVRDQDDDDDDDADADEEEDEEEEEVFDIDDTSTAATRASSPSLRKNGEDRRHSTTELGGSSHHHHHHRRRSSGPSSAPGSSMSLLGLQPLTSAGQSSGARNNSKSMRKSLSSRQLFTNTPHDDSSIQHQHGVVDPSGRSVLDSPDRFGLAGPPEPPRAISERHLATADFRLDDPNPSVEEDAVDDQENVEGEKGDEKNIPVTGTELRDSILDVAERKAQIASDNNKLYRKLKKHSNTSTGTTREPRAAPSKNLGEDSIVLGNSNRRTVGTRPHGGGAALVVYGQDESDSDSTPEG